MLYVTIEYIESLEIEIGMSTSTILEYSSLCKVEEEAQKKKRKETSINKLIPTSKNRKNCFIDY